MDYTYERLALALAPRPIEFYPTITSTNDRAMQLLADGVSNGSVVIADEQTHGRGRLGRTWYTPPGVALALSVIILQPPAAYLNQVNMAASLAVYDLLIALNIQQVVVKWSNDVLVNDRKICGILTEAYWDGDKLKGVVLGMGVNVRNEFSDVDLASIATTIEAEIQREVDRVSLLAVLLFHLDKWLALLGNPAILDAYKAKMTMLGKPITVFNRGSSEEIHGVAIDVDTEGALIIEQDSGVQQRIFAGDVTLHKKGT